MTKVTNTVPASTAEVEHFSDFLKRNDLTANDIHLIAGGASGKRFYRVFTGRILLDAAREPGTIERFVRVSDILKRAGLSVPQVYDADKQMELALIEDFGSMSMADLLARGLDENLYANAIDALAILHKNSLPNNIELPLFDLSRMISEVTLAIDWFVPHLNIELSSTFFRDDYINAWEEVLVNFVKRDTLVLADYGAENIMVLQGRSGYKSCGILDFEDAVVGVGTYDVVSLLHSSRRDIPVDLVNRMIVRYAQRADIENIEAYEESLAVMSAQRHCRILGVFVRLAYRDGKRHYLSFLPRVLAMITRELSHPTLAPVRRVVDKLGMLNMPLPVALQP